MKHLSVLLFALLLASCGGSGSKAANQADAEQVAQSFLSSYLHLDFAQALPLCDSVLKADLEQSAQSVNRLSPEMQERLKADLKAYTFKVETIDISKAKDSAFVSYTINTPEAPEGLASHLTLVKIDKEWKVTKLL